jgi:hypothetical protein
MEPIDAEESKLILQALAQADWTKPVTPMDVSAQRVFNQLNLTAKDGWTRPKVAKEFPTAAKKWLQENAGKYRIQRYASAKAEEK